MSLKSEIDALTAKFASELEALIRRAAVAAVTSSLGESSAPAAAPPRKPSRPAAKPSTGGIVKIKASQAVAAQARKKAGKRVRRSPRQLQAAAEKIFGYVRANPGANAEKIKKALGIASNEWSRPLALLLDAKRLVARGEKRSTTYTAR